VKSELRAGLYGALYTVRLLLLLLQSI